MSLSEALSEGLMVTGVGLVIVFSVLVILMIAMMLMKVVFYKPNGTKPTSAPVPTPAPAPKAAVQPAVASDMDESELVAVLTAAIAASLNTSTYNLNVKSFRRVDNAAPAWNKAGLNDVIGSRF